MNEINKSSEQSLNAILSKLGIKTQEEVKKQGNKNSLGQEDFLKLMTTQLQNQDPFAPMDNGDFIAQMAQFSTVTGITEINNNLSLLITSADSCTRMHQSTAMHMYMPYRQHP